MPSNSLPDDPFIGLPTRRPEMAILVRCEEKSPVNTSIPWPVVPSRILVRLAIR